MPFDWASLHLPASFLPSPPGNLPSAPTAPITAQCSFSPAFSVLPSGSLPHFYTPSQPLHLLAHPLDPEPMSALLEAFSNLSRQSTSPSSEFSQSFAHSLCTMQLPCQNQLCGVCLLWTGSFWRADTLQLCISMCGRCSVDGSIHSVPYVGVSQVCLLNPAFFSISV